MVHWIFPVISTLFYSQDDVLAAFQADQDSRIEDVDIFGYDGACHRLADTRDQQQQQQQTKKRKSAQTVRTERNDARRQCEMTLAAAAERAKVRHTVQKQQQHSAYKHQPCLALSQDDSSRARVAAWEATQDSYLISAFNKTIPVIDMLPDGTTVHLVGDTTVNVVNLDPASLPCPQTTTEIFLSVEEITAVEAYDNDNAKDCMLFINGMNSRETNGNNLRAEADACKVRTKQHSCYNSICFTAVFSQSPGNSMCCTAFLTWVVPSVHNTDISYATVRPILIAYLLPLGFDCFHPMQRQAKRRKLRLLGGDNTTMMDIMKQDMSAVAAPKCQAIQKNKSGDIKCNAPTAMGLLTCANHKDFPTWGTVPI